MINKKNYRICALVAAVALVLPWVASAQRIAIEDRLGPPDLEYAADSMFEVDEVALGGRVYRAPGRERRELTIDGRRVVTILRLDRDLAWVLIPELQAYVDLSLDDPLVSRYQPLPRAGDELRLVADGDGNVGGQPTSRHHVYGMTADGALFEGRVWLAESGVVLKAEEWLDGEPRGARVELENVELGRQHPMLFEVPAGYTRLEREALVPAADEEIEVAGGVRVGGLGVGGQVRLKGGLDTLLRAAESAAETGLRIAERAEDLDRRRQASSRGSSRSRPPREAEVRRGTGVIACRPGQLCRCSPQGECVFNCPTGDCDLACSGQSGCTFNCDPGGCGIRCDGQANCLVNCENGCDVVCSGQADCSGRW